MQTSFITERLRNPDTADPIGYFAAALGRRLGAVLRLARARLLAPATLAGVNPARRTRRARVILLTGCAQTVLEINAAIIRLLTRLGLEVVVPQSAECCSALTHQTGEYAQAIAGARANLAPGATRSRAPVSTPPSPTPRDAQPRSSIMALCSELSPSLQRGLEEVSAIRHNISELLVRIGYQPRRPAPGLTGSYHAACSLQHGEKVTEEPKPLSRRAGFTVAKPAELDICSGSARPYNTGHAHSAIA